LKYRKEIERSKKNYEIKDFITDLIGIRVICMYESDIEKVVEVIKENFETLDITNKTLQLLQKKDTFGYKGVHLDLKLNQERSGFKEYQHIAQYQFEVQVRSIVQDAWSEVDHKLKYKKSLSDKLQRRVINLAALFEMADREFDAIRLETKAEIEEKIKQEELLLKEKLDVGNFLNYCNSVFKDFVFEDYKVEGFIYEIVNLKELTIGDLKVAFETHNNLIERYKKYREDTYGDKMNPYTILRHTLYTHNSRTFQSLLFDLQRDNYNNWLGNNPQ
jgi:ppGpp synthetase/RelA/SpoT-type nucleotidyltranferase